MLQQDYLARMLMRLAEAISKSLAKAKDDDDPEEAAVLLENAIGEATELDGAVLLSLAPESIASVVQISGTDPRVVEYIARTLMLEASYLEDAGKSEKAALRNEQAFALANAYGIDVSSVELSEEEFEAFFEETKPL